MDFPLWKLDQFWRLDRSNFASELSFNGFKGLVVKYLTFWLFEMERRKDRFNGFATVTFKQARQFDGGSLVWITRDVVEDTCSVIRDRVFKRLKRKFSWVTTIENGNGEKRLHLHMAIAIPDDISFDDFSMVFLDICGRMEWVHKRVDLRSVADSDHDDRKILFYMFKEGGDALAVNASTFIGLSAGR